MTCEGTTDSGAASVLIQINGENVGHDENITFNENIGELLIENVEVVWGDTLSFEVGAIYSNIIPLFTVTSTTFGGGIISKTRSRNNILLEKIKMDFPIFNNILTSRIFNRLLNL